MKNFVLTLSLLLSGTGLAQTTESSNTKPESTKAEAQATKPADAKTVVARINGKEVTLAEYEDAFRIAVARMVNTQGMPYEAKMLSDFDELRPSFLKQLVRDRIITSLAAKNHQPNKEEVEAQYKGSRDRFKSDADFVKALGTIGFMSAAEYRSELDRRSIEKAYQKALFDQFKFGDQAVATYYSANRATFKKKAEACVKHILVKEQKNAEKIAKQLKGGADFAKLAKEKSQDPGSAKQGGDLGCILPGDTVPSFDKASFNGPLKKVQMVQSKYGWHLVVVNKRTQAGYKPLKEVSGEIREKLGREAAQKYLDAQVAKVKVESFPEVVTKVKKAAPKKEPKAPTKTEGKKEGTEQKDK